MENKHIYRKAKHPEHLIVSCSLTAAGKKRFSWFPISGRKCARLHTNEVPWHLDKILQKLQEAPGLLHRLGILEENPVTLSIIHSTKTQVESEGSIFIFQVRLFKYINKFKRVHIICLLDLGSFPPFPLKLGAPLAQAPPYLAINPESASLLIQLDGSDTRNFASLLDVAAVGADGQTHQIHPHDELLLEGRHQLPGALNKEENASYLTLSDDTEKHSCNNLKYVFIREVIKLKNPHPPADTGLFWSTLVVFR